MIDTVLAQPLNGGAMRATVYRQLIDLIAQGRADHDDGLAMRAYEAIDQIRDEVPVQARAAIANGLAGLPVPKRLVAHFAAEQMRDVARFIVLARLKAQDWLDILPGLNPQARSLLRSRRDLPESVMKALDAFGPSDLRLLPPDEPELPWTQERSGEEGGSMPPLAANARQSQPAAGRHYEAARRVDHLFAAAPAAAPERPPPAEPRDPAVTAGETQIRELLNRIEAFRQRVVQRPGPFTNTDVADAEPAAGESVTPPAAPPPQAAPVLVTENTQAPGGAATPETPARSNGFRWEADAVGTIIWVEGVPREAVIGRSVGLSEPEAIEGVDMRTATAFARRAPFRDGRLRLPGSGEASGLWLISGVPYFDPRGGKFGGFRGTARRFDEAPVSAVEPQQRSEIVSPAEPPSPDAVRQMAHELRTPLNAIVGFAEMIDQQMLGPAAQNYRDRAKDILSDAHRLIAAIDDMDATARGVDGAPGGPPLVDAGNLVERIIGRYQGLSRERGIELVGSVAMGLPAVETSEEVLERVISRLFAAVIGAARAGDVLTYGVGPGDGDSIRIFLSRPGSLAGRAAESLYDPASSGFAAGLEAPAIGLGFGLRLVRQLASALGGKFEIEDMLFLLSLPCSRLRRHVAGGAG